MKSRLQFAGHPIHVMVVGFPIGLYTSALVCDGLYLMLHDASWFRMASWAIIFGLVTHVPAATGDGLHGKHKGKKHFYPPCVLTTGLNLSPPALITRKKPRDDGAR